MCQKRNTPKKKNPQSYEVLSSKERETEDGEVDFESRQPSSSALLEEQFIITVCFPLFLNSQHAVLKEKRRKGKMYRPSCVVIAPCNDASSSALNRYFEKNSMRATSKSLKDQ